MTNHHATWLVDAERVSQVHRPLILFFLIQDGGRLICLRDPLSIIVQQICVKYHKNCGFGGKSTKIGTDHAEYT